MSTLARGRAARAGRVLLRVLGALALLALLTPIGCRVAASLRETEPARELAPRDGRFIDAAGLDTYVRTLRATRGRPTVVLIHGSMAWSGTWDDLAERVAAGGYPTVAIDLPPFGFTERPADHDYGREAQARRVRDVLDALSLRRVVLVGHSFGGGATVEAAMTDGDRVRALALLDVALGLDETEPSGLPMSPILGVDAIREAVVATTFTNPHATASGLRDFVHDDAVVTDERVAIYQLPLEVRGTTHAVSEWLVSGLYRDERSARSGDEAAYRAFAPPVLVLWGREDEITPLSQGEHIARLFPSSELVVLDDVGHIPHVEDVDAVAEHLLAFLDALPRR